MQDAHLLRSRRFLPLFITQFLGAFNDNFFKNAFVALLVYRVAAETGENTHLHVVLSGAIFISPYFLFSATAGQLADKYDKAMLARITKLWEIIILAMAAAAFYIGNSWLLQLVLFCLGVQATFFGPVKYALLPQHLREKEIVLGNAYIEAGTFLAILIGTLLGQLLVLQPGGIAIVSAGMVLCAAGGYFSSRFIPPAPAPLPNLEVGWNIWRETWKVVRLSQRVPEVYQSILGSSWFWFVGAALMAQFPVFARDVIGGDETVFALLLGLFSVGIGAGSMLCNRLLGGRVEATFVPLAALLLSVFSCDLYYASRGLPVPAGEALMSAGAFIQMAGSTRILIDLFMIALSAGLYIVPLYAIMQERSAPEERARVIASNNIINAIYIVVSAVFILGLDALGFTIPATFMAIGLINLVVAIYICRLLPDALLRSLARVILRRLWRVEVKGLEHFEKAGDKVLLVANHASFLDAALIAAFMPEKVTFAVNTHIAQRWWMKPLLSLVDAYPLDPTNPLATKALIEALRAGRKVMIFPEGRITVTGALMKIYEGPAMIADRSGALVLPIRIEGAQYTPFSRLRGKVRIRWFPRIRVTVMPPRAFAVDESIKGRRRRQLASAELYDVMSQMMFDSSAWRKPLFASLLTARKIHGGSHVIAEDVERKPLSYDQFISRAFVLGRLICRLCPGEGTIGLLLPTSSAGCLAFFGLHAYSRVPAMLNFTAGGAALATACHTARVKSVITSRRFIEMAKLDAAVDTLTQAGIRVHYLEDARKKLRFTDKLIGAAGLVSGRFLYKFTADSHAEDEAVILFTSGSEGTPKGVVLSHANLQANRLQLTSRIDFGPQDIVFNCLPMFHAFGLTGGTLLPLLSGVRTFFYPSPLHYRIVPELVYDTNATIFFGTDTFLSGYARQANPYDLHSVRYIFAGAEKLKEETRRAYAEKFGVRIFEGYGATETAPVLSTNTPMQSRTGSVGRFMPGIEYQLQPVPGIEEGGQLWVRGPNIMMGYYKADQPGLLQPPQDGWYDTGDIVTVDADGYIFIKGRTKRFAKIGGEMVSLGKVEAAADELWPGAGNAAVTLPDARKGEQILLLTGHQQAERGALLAHFREAGLPEIAMPRTVLILDKLPMLGTGKVDYQGAKKIAEDWAKQNG